MIITTKIKNPIRIELVGKSNEGKTYLILRFQCRTSLAYFPDESRGIETLLKDIKIYERKKWLYIFNTISEDSHIAPFLKNWDQLHEDVFQKYEAIIFMYDVRDPDSFEYIKKRRKYF